MAFNVYVCMYRFQFTNHSVDLQKSSQKRIQNTGFVLKSSWITLRHSIYIIVRELHVENECKREYSVQIKRLEWRYQQQISVRFESWTKKCNFFSCEPFYRWQSWLFWLLEIILSITTVSTLYFKNKFWMHFDVVPLNRWCSGILSLRIAWT